MISTFEGFILSRRFALSSCAHFSFEFCALAVYLLSCWYTKKVDNLGILTDAGLTLFLTGISDPYCHPFLWSRYRQCLWSGESLKLSQPNCVQLNPNPVSGSSDSFSYGGYSRNSWLAMVRPNGIFPSIHNSLTRNYPGCLSSRLD